MRRRASAAEPVSMPFLKARTRGQYALGMRLRFMGGSLECFWNRKRPNSATVLVSTSHNRVFQGRHNRAE